jgi:hypothetical protein
MAVNRIILRDGKKVCIPILKKEEYIALRDSKYNADCVEKTRNGETFTTRSGEQKSYKTRLEQFNYSCIPNEDGTLKGAVQPANSVGMDVDFNEAEIGKIPEVVERILAKKDEIGLLMLEKSATKGLHLVFKRKPELSQEENLKSVSETLNLPFDEGAKDITRVFFTPTSQDIIFIDERLFDFGECGKAEEKGKKQSKTKKEEERNLNVPISEKAEKANLIAFELCVKEAGLNSDALDVWGERNWHKNLMSVLSAGLAKLMSREQAFAVVAEKLPNYSQYDDCKALINYFYDNYNTAYMSQAVRQINAKAQEMASCKEQDDEEELDTEGYNPPEPPKRLTRLHKLLIGNFDERYKAMILLASIPEMAAHASHYMGEYINGNVIGAQDFVAVIGSSGSGKGNATVLHNIMVENTLRASDFKEFEKVKANLEEREKKANAKEKPPKYHPKLRLFETTSSSSILELQTNLGNNGMLLGHFSEADGFGVGGGSSQKMLSLLFRKGWSGEVHTQFYLSDASCNSMVRMRLAVLVCGTVNSIVGGILSGKNTENGMMQRFIPVVMPRKKRTFRPPVGNRLTNEEKEELQQMLVKLYTQDLALGDNTVTLELPQTRKVIEKWYDDLEERYNNGELTEAEADLSARVGEHMMRAAIPHVALEGKESKEVLEFIKWVGDIAFYNLCWLFGHCVQKDLEEAKEMMGSHQDLRKTAEPILDKLPNVFTTQQMRDLRRELGQSENCNMLLSRYVLDGKLKRLEKGVFQKITKTE